MYHCSNQKLFSRDQKLREFNFDFSAGGGFALGENPETDQASNSLFLSGSAYGLDLSLGLKEVKEHKNLFNANIGYGILGLAVYFR